MSGDGALGEEALAWIEKAEQHLASARILDRQGGPCAVACFLCQQAAETALKALLIGIGEESPRTHDLVALWRMLPPGSLPGGVSVEHLARWTDYAIAPRYPGFPDARAVEDLPTMIAGADLLVAGVRRKLEGH